MSLALVQERDVLPLRPLSTEGESLLTDGWQGSQKSFPIAWWKKQTDYLCGRFRRKAKLFDRSDDLNGRKKNHQSLGGLKRRPTFAVRFERKAINDGPRPRLDTTFFDLMQQPKSIFARGWSFHSSEWGEIHSPPGGWHRLLREKMKNDSRESTHQTLTMESLILAQDER